MNFRFRDNPMSRIAINSAGYRGPEWPAAGESTDEIIVVGDSQVFGLGVEDDETFAAVLGRLLDRPVINAAREGWQIGDWHQASVNRTPCSAI